MFDTVSVPAGATAGVLLIHGGTGRGAHERERCDPAALTIGYVVYAPDLFGEVFTDRDRGRAVIGGAR